ncbi:hypothetical protein KEM52_004351, partial [Ascosphaera acerosa]
PQQQSQPQHAFVSPQQASPYRYQHPPVPQYGPEAATAAAAAAANVVVAANAAGASPPAFASPLSALYPDLTGTFSTPTGPTQHSSTGPISPPAAGPMADLYYSSRFATTKPPSQPAAPTPVAPTTPAAPNVPRFNVRATEFRPNPAATTFMPGGTSPALPPPPAVSTAPVAPTPADAVATPAATAPAAPTASTAGSATTSAAATAAAPVAAAAPTAALAAARPAPSQPVPGPAPATAPVTPLQPAVAAAMFWSDRKPMLPSERPSIRDHFNTLRQIKADAAATASKDTGAAAALAARGGYPPAYRTPPTWETAPGNENKTYKELFRSPNGGRGHMHSQAPSLGTQPQMPLIPHIQGQQPHQQSQTPVAPNVYPQQHHLPYQMRPHTPVLPPNMPGNPTMPPVPSHPQFGTAPHQHLGGGMPPYEDHQSRMQQTPLPTGIYQSPRMQQAPMAAAAAYHQPPMGGPATPLGYGQPMPNFYGHQPGMRYPNGMGQLISPHAQQHPQHPQHTMGMNMGMTPAGTPMMGVPPIPTGPGSGVTHPFVTAAGMTMAPGAMHMPYHGGLNMYTSPPGASVPNGISGGVSAAPPTATPGVFPSPNPNRPATQAPTTTPAPGAAMMVPQMSSQGMAGPAPPPSSLPGVHNGHGPMPPQPQPQMGLYMNPQSPFPAQATPQLPQGATAARPPYGPAGPGNTTHAQQQFPSSPRQSSHHPYGGHGHGHGRHHGHNHGHNHNQHGGQYRNYSGHGAPHHGGPQPSQTAAGTTAPSAASTTPLAQPAQQPQQQQQQEQKQQQEPASATATGEARK